MGVLFFFLVLSLGIEDKVGLFGWFGGVSSLLRFGWCLFVCLVDLWVGLVLFLGLSVVSVKRRSVGRAGVSLFIGRFGGF